MLNALAGFIAALLAFFHPAPSIAPIQPKLGGSATWVKTDGSPLYDTPSGNLDRGFYTVLPDSSILANEATTTIPSATTTSTIIPAGPHLVRTIPIGFTLAKVIGTRYVDYFSDGSSQVGDPTVGDSLIQKGTPTPIKGAPNTAPQ